MGRPRKEIGSSTEFASPGAKVFGQLLKQYRESHRLSLRGVAGILGQAESTIFRIEDGQRNPPRNPAFYDRLFSLPDISTREVLGMMDTDGAPEWFKEIRRTRLLEEHPPFAVQSASFQGVHITMEIVPSQAVRELLSQPGEISRLLRFLKKVTEEVVLPNALNRLQEDRGTRVKITQILNETH